MKQTDSQGGAYYYRSQSAGNLQSLLTDEPESRITSPSIKICERVKLVDPRDSETSEQDTYEAEKVRKGSSVQSSDSVGRNRRSHSSMAHSSSVAHLLDQNKEWAAQMEKERPGFFTALMKQQRPRYFWIGCADSRVPANEIIGLPPGEVFVHRNVANLVVHSDLNVIATLEFAIKVLGVSDIIVCGHYGCGGIKAALKKPKDRIVDHWLRHVRDISKFYRAELDEIQDDEERTRRLCELNVAVQVVHVQESPIVITHLEKGNIVRTHAWIYDVGDGIIKDITWMVDKVRAREPNLFESPPSNPISPLKFCGSPRIGHFPLL